MDISTLVDYMPVISKLHELLKGTNSTYRGEVKVMSPLKSHLMNAEFWGEKLSLLIEYTWIGGKWVHHTRVWQIERNARRNLYIINTPLEEYKEGSADEIAAHIAGEIIRIE